MTVVKKVIKALENDGLVFVSQKGSHMKYRKDNKVCIVPNHKGTFLKELYRRLLEVQGLIFNSLLQQTHTIVIDK